jgi:hypothetical protein
MLSDLLLLIRDGSASVVGDERSVPGVLRLGLSGVELLDPDDSLEFDLEVDLSETTSWDVLEGLEDFLDLSDLRLLFLE